jgi:hypothetical protein
MQLTLPASMPGIQVDRRDLTRSAAATAIPAATVSIDRVSLSDEALAALARDLKGTESDLPPANPNGQILVAEKVPEFDAEAYNACCRAWVARGPDLRDIANALAVSLKGILSERPDLADTHFDIRSDNGRVTVVSQEMSQADSEWLGGQLYLNDDLTKAVNQFHDDTVNMYALYWKGVGQPLTDGELAEAHRGVDEFNLLEQLHTVGDAVQRMYASSPDLTFLDGNGEVMSFDTDPTTPRGLLDFMDKMKLFDAEPMTVLGRGGRNLGPQKFNDPFDMIGRLLPTYSPKTPRK